MDGPKVNWKIYDTLNSSLRWMTMEVSKQMMVDSNYVADHNSDHEVDEAPTPVTLLPDDDNLPDTPMIDIASIKSEATEYEHLNDTYSFSLPGFHSNNVKLEDRSPVGRRTKPWTEFERLYFLQLIKLKSDVLLARLSNKVTQHSKKAVWTWIREEMLKKGFIDRPLKSFMEQWRDIKCRRKDVIAHYLRNCQQTNGNPTIELCATDQMVLELLGADHPVFNGMPTSTSSSIVTSGNTMCGSSNSNSSECGTTSTTHTTTSPAYSNHNTTITTNSSSSINNGSCNGVLVSGMSGDGDSSKPHSHHTNHSHGGLPSDEPEPPDHHHHNNTTHNHLDDHKSPHQRDNHHDTTQHRHNTNQQPNNHHCNTNTKHHPPMSSIPPLLHNESHSSNDFEPTPCSVIDLGASMTSTSRKRLCLDDNVPPKKACLDKKSKEEYLFSLKIENEETRKRLLEKQHKNEDMLLQLRLHNEQLKKSVLTAKLHYYELKSKALHSSQNDT